VDYQAFISKISFKFLQPDAVRGQDGRYVVERGDRPPARLLEVPFAPVDVVNTVLPSSAPVTHALKELCDLPRMSTVSIAAMLNEAVARMAPGQAFVNVGVWHGYTFLSSLACNEDKPCIGIDDFSLFGGPEAQFRREFEARRSDNHSFHSMDYRDYFAKVHDGPIGVYCYDGSHDYESQWNGLEVAEPFFDEGCLVVVDDTNWAPVWRATMEFAAASRRRYRLVTHAQTTDPEHPTYWNGVLVLRVEGESDTGAAGIVGPPPPPPAAESDFPIPQTTGEPLVSVIVQSEDDDDDVGATIESVRSQTWPAVEVIVADGDALSLAAALAASQGEFVTVVRAGARLPERAVHIGLGRPGFRRALVTAGGNWYRDLDDLLAAAEDIRAVLPPDARLILIDENAGRPKTLGNLVKYPIEGGHPADDAHAIRDLESLRKEGTGFIAFLAPAFWWLEYYADLDRHLRANYRCALENDRVIAFDLT
jgi:Methyltransferase domain